MYLLIISHYSTQNSRITNNNKKKNEPLNRYESNNILRASE